MRYAIETLQPLLRRRCTQRWLEQATELQTGMGRARDVVQAGVLLGRLEAEPELVEFLRGMAFGQGQT